MTWGLPVIQSLSQINNIVVVPSKSQTTVHPQTGKRERIFVDLATLYPTPEEAGTELSFEEVMAARRGWLDHTWGDEAFDVSLIAEPADVGDVDRVAKDVGTKLVIHRDDIHAPLDENGAPVQQSKPRGKKKKVMEVNETQISEYKSRRQKTCPGTNPEQSRLSWTRRRDRSSRRGIPQNRQ